MGWWSYRRDAGARDLDHFRHELLGTTSPDGTIVSEHGRRYRLIDGATKNHSVFYGALEVSEPGKITYVTALVILIRRWRSTAPAANFGYKPIEETMGPTETGCPERILRLLSPVDQNILSSDSARENAAAWRAACWEEINEAKTRPPLTVGDTVIFVQPLTFANDETVQAFRCSETGRRVRFWALRQTDGGGFERLFCCRLPPRARWTPHTIIKATPPKQPDAVAP